jgi:membrane-associated phospholipid phosphatase
MSRSIRTLMFAAVTAVAATSGMVAATAAGAGHTAGAAVAGRAGPGQLVVDWNDELLTIQATPGAQPATVHPTRALAIMHTAIYDAVASITHHDRPYLFELAAARTARPDAAADQAAHDALVAMYPTKAPEVDDLLTRELATVPTGSDTDAGRHVGHLAATLLLAARADDGSATPPPPFTVPAPTPGAYQLTPPNQPTPVFTNWAAVTPFLLDAADRFRPAPPPDMLGRRWADAIGETQRLGQDTSTSRTADQTTVAKFWSPAIWTTWNEIADGQVLTRRTNLTDASKVLASLDLTIADTTIAMYDSKYHFQWWRPITAIRAGTPGNPDVTADPAWNALANTAPDPSYPGAHSSISAAAATVLTQLFGPYVDLHVSSDALPGITRHFTSFNAAATEAGLSRIYAGQHTRLDHDAGVAIGRSVARFDLKRLASTRL